MQPRRQHHSGRVRAGDVYKRQTDKSQVSQKTFDATAYQAAGYSDAQIKTMMEQSLSLIHI